MDGPATEFSTAYESNVGTGGAGSTKELLGVGVLVNGNKDPARDDVIELPRR